MRIDTRQQPHFIAEGGEDAITLEQMQEAVGGYIEYATFAQDVDLPIPTHEGLRMAKVLQVIANEEGLMMGLKSNAIGTYCAFGVPIPQAPQMIVGDVLVQVRLDEDAREVSPTELMSLLNGEQAHDSHMMPSPQLHEADYTCAGDEQE